MTTLSLTQIHWFTVPCIITSKRSVQTYRTYRGLSDFPVRIWHTIFDSLQTVCYSPLCDCEWEASSSRGLFTDSSWTVSVSQVAVVLFLPNVIIMFLLYVLARFYYRWVRTVFLILCLLDLLNLFLKILLLMDYLFNLSRCVAVCIPPHLCYCGHASPAVCLFDYAVHVHCCHRSYRFCC